MCVSDSLEFVRTLTRHVRRDRARERKREKEKEREREGEREKERENMCVRVCVCVCVCVCVTIISRDSLALETRPHRSAEFVRTLRCHVFADQ